MDPQEAIQVQCQPNLNHSCKKLRLGLVVCNTYFDPVVGYFLASKYQGKDNLPLKPGNPTTRTQYLTSQILCLGIILCHLAFGAKLTLKLKRVWLSVPFYGRFKRLCTEKGGNTLFGLLVTSIKGCKKSYCDAEIRSPRCFWGVQDLCRRHKPSRDQDIMIG